MATDREIRRAKGKRDFRRDKRQAKRNGDISLEISAMREYWYNIRKMGGV